ncbi:hypothetical protein HO173_012465 [Letharia columbiana]|uniref:Uncharacterized protein n=1 Tax=Letharia columbiana TaxID=112416 RepID=A0A8H6CMX7_9LECA|nr:uncharacterized protein HO173_012465 [Letharia columbiana]KAF6226635.1 hypothetical protein HO173_012465 [Letharia columbiana]
MFSLMYSRIRDSGRILRKQNQTACPWIEVMREDWPAWVKSLHDNESRDKSALGVWTDPKSIQHHDGARCEHCVSRDRDKQEKWQRDLPSRTNLEIVIDEAPRTSKRLWIEASRNQPRIWTIVFSGMLKRMGCSVRILGWELFDKVRCPLPGCNSKKSAMDLEQHVLYMKCATSPTQFHVPTSTAQIAHVATRQGKLATTTGTPMVRRPSSAFLLVVKIWMCCTITKIRESQENDAITGNERQVERFMQDGVDISEINSAGTAYCQDEAALDDDIEHEEEEDEFEEEEGEYESGEEAVSTVKDNLSIRTIIDCTISVGKTRSDFLASKITSTDEIL